VTGVSVQGRWVDYKSVYAIFSNTDDSGGGGEMADRRAGKVPHVSESGGGKQPRSRNQNGQWRRKRSDAGKTRKTIRKR